VGREVVATTSVATFVFLYNMLTGGYDDLSQIHHDAIISFLPRMTLPLAPFNLASSSLGLLLGTLVSKECCCFWSRRMAFLFPQWLCRNESACRIFGFVQSSS
jgi:hypothetical protein